MCQNPDEIAPFAFPQRPPWIYTKPEIDLSLREFEKDSTSCIIFNSKFAELYRSYKPLYTDGSKALDRVAAAATSDKFQSQIRLPDNASIYTAELQALKMAFNLIQHTAGN